MTDWRLIAWGLGLVALGGSMPEPVQWGSGWCWPVPTWVTPDGRTYEAVVSSGFGSRRSGGQHRGLDVMYRRRTSEDLSEYPAGLRGPDGCASTRGHVMPCGAPALAARAGQVWSVRERTDGGGWSVVIDHGSPWTTYYTHLREPYVRPGGVVAAGDEIAAISCSAYDSERVRHLHFEARHAMLGSVDASSVMGAWQRATWRPTRW